MRKRGYLKWVKSSVIQHSVTGQAVPKILKANDPSNKVLLKKQHCITSQKT